MAFFQNQNTPLNELINTKTFVFKKHITFPSPCTYDQTVDGEMK